MSTTAKQSRGQAAPAKAYKVHAVRDILFVRKLKAAAETSGGLALPDTAEPDIITVDVVIAGPGLEDGKGGISPMCCGAGSRILVRRVNLKPVILNGEDFWLCTERDVIAELE